MPRICDKSYRDLTKTQADVTHPQLLNIAANRRRLFALGRGHAQHHIDCLSSLRWRLDVRHLSRKNQSCVVQVRPPVACAQWRRKCLGRRHPAASPPCRCRPAHHLDAQTALEAQNFAARDCGWLDARRSIVHRKSADMLTLWRAQLFLISLDLSCRRRRKLEKKCQSSLTVQI